MPLRAWYEGEAVAHPLAAARGLHYGDGVFRTLRVEAGLPLDLDLHLDQLALDAARLGLRPAERAQLAGEACAACRGHERAVLKILLMRRADGRGYRPGSDDSERLLLLYPAPEPAPALREQGARADVSPLRLAVQPALAGAKHLNRLEQVLASRDWPAGIDERLLLDADGALVGGTRTNLFWVDAADTLLTPRLDRCGVEGVTRRKIIGLSRELHVRVDMVRAPLAALHGAAEAFVCNSVIGIWPLREVDGQPLAAPGPLTRRLLQALDAPEH